MCGILGALGTRQPDVLLAEARRAAICLEHRGPDGSGYLGWDAARQNLSVFHGEAPKLSVACTGADSRNAVLMHQRLAILDLSAEAAQPLTTADGLYSVIHNGEIYNYRDLRRELEGLGHRFHSSSDSEVLLAAYAQWGVACLQRLEGMFAFAVLDLKRRVLFLARDPFGIKPLFYAAKGSDFAFASEIPALLEMSWVSRRANPHKIFEHLNYWTTDATEGTFFASVRTLPAAHYLECPLQDTERTPAPVRYWDIPPDQDSRATPDEAAAHLRDLFLESVMLHLQSDVPWCVALSGGADSSSLTMGARRILGADAPLHTVSYVADQPHLNEEIWIDTVNLAARATAHKLSIRDSDLGDDFVRLVRTQGQPMVTPVVYAQHRVFRHAGESGFKVLLEGQGADELLAGYPFYLQARLATMIKTADWLAAAQFLWTAPPKFLTGRRYVLHHALRRAFPRLTRPLASMAPWLSRSWARQAGVNDDPAPFDPLSRAGGHCLREMIYDTVTQTKLPSLLRYGDHNAMAASVENRVPFLTRKLVLFLFSLPERFIIADDGTTKNVFRHAMRGLTPEFVLRRRNKIGFEPPYQAWTGAMAPQLVDVLRTAKVLPCFDENGLEAVIAEIKRDGIRTAAFANRVWRIASLAEWARQFGVSA